jgi:hypothetical protein
MVDRPERTPSPEAGAALDDDPWPLQLDPPRLHRLLDAVRALNADLDLRVTLRHITEVAVELVGAKYGAIGVLDPDRTYLSDFITVGVDDTTREAIGHLPRGRASSAMSSGTPSRCGCATSPPSPRASASRRTTRRCTRSSVCRSSSTATCTGTST